MGIIGFAALDGIDFSKVGSLEDLTSEIEERGERLEEREKLRNEAVEKIYPTITFKTRGTFNQVEVVRVGSTGVSVLVRGSRYPDIEQFFHTEEIPDELKKEWGIDE